MSKIDLLRLLINERLTAAAEEIFAVFGRTIAEYEEQISSYKRDMERQRRLQELRRQPLISLQPDARSEQRDWICESTPHIKEEEVEPKEEGPAEEEPHEEVPQDEHNHVQLVLFQSGGVRNKLDLDHMTTSLTKFPSQDSMDPVNDPQLGTSVQQACADLDSLDASGNGQLDSMELEEPLSEVVDSYICTICGRAFAQRAHWAKHVQVHRKVESKIDKSYTCDICGKRLTRFDGYQKHLRIHTGEKPYSCEECGRRFSDHSNYKRHIRTHTTSKTQQS